MNKTLGIIVIGLILLPCIKAPAAEKVKAPSVEYSADMTIESGGYSTTGKVYHALDGKDRMEMSSQGTGTITITRTDKKVAWVLMPAQNMYMEMSLEDSAQNKKGTDVTDCEMDFSSQGAETINGVRAVRNKVTGTCPDNVKYDGTMWITKDNIMVKMDAVTTADGRQSSVKMDLKNLKTGQQAASLFEIPAGYRKFSMGNMSSTFDTAQGTQAAQDEDYNDGADRKGVNPVDAVDDAADSANETLDTTDKVKDTVNRLKGLFGK